jgi:hypothetical protein
VTTSYPLHVVDERDHPPGFNGVVHVWDVDKTYLSTHFSSLRGLSRVPFELAVDKRAIPGMPELLRGLRRGAGAGFACTPLYFVSASPPQLRGVLQRKMVMDGVEYDGFVFKDWVRTVRALRPGRLREQVGFKVCALLTARAPRPLSREYLFGDDVEKDAEAYSLYAAMLHGELSPGAAEAALKEAGVPRDDRRAIHALVDRLPSSRGRVERIFIHLETGRPPAAFDRWGPRVVPVRGAAQLALALFQHGLVSAPSARAARAACASAYPHLALEPTDDDAVRRGLISAQELERLGEESRPPVAAGRD